MVTQGGGGEVLLGGRIMWEFSGGAGNVQYLDGRDIYMVYLSRFINTALRTFAFQLHSM